MNADIYKTGYSVPCRCIYNFLSCPTKSTNTSDSRTCIQQQGALYQVQRAFALLACFKNVHKTQVMMFGVQGLVYAGAAVALGYFVWYGGAVYGLDEINRAPKKWQRLQEYKAQVEHISKELKENEEQRK
jgi:hypothetical protein